MLIECHVCGKRATYKEMVVQEFYPNGWRNGKAYRLVCLGCATDAG